MIRRLYVHNFRCLENFELPISGLSSVLLIGSNGSGKTTVGLALEILQKIARGTNQVGELVRPEDLSRGRSDVPMRIEIEVELERRVHRYAIALELPKGSKELHILEERLDIDGEVVYAREAEQIQLAFKPSTSLAEMGRAQKNKFPIDRQFVALPLIHERLLSDPLVMFKQWLGRIIILRPVPSLIYGDSSRETLQPNPQVSDIGAWFSGILSDAPSSWARIDQHLRQVMPDFKEIKNLRVGRDSKSLAVHFASDQGSLEVPFGDLSDGEKCFVICALVLATHDANGGVFCFWDEPDNYLALSEVGHFILALRRAYQSGGQFIATSHNPEAIRRFSHENTLVLYRKSHLEPTMVRPLSELQVNGDLVGALVRGDLEP